MRWLQARGGAIDRFCQSVLLRVPGGLREADLVGAVQALLDHHDALRLRLTGAAAGSGDDWAIEVMPVGSVAAASCLRRVDVEAADAAAVSACVAAAAEAAEGGLSPWSGVMLQAVWLDAGAGSSGRLLLTIHHLAVDGVSWRILVEDIAAAWRQVAAGAAVALPAVGTSLRQWSQQLVLQAQAAAVVAELPVWRRQLWALCCRWLPAGWMRAATWWGRRGICGGRCRLR